MQNSTDPTDAKCATQNEDPRKLIPDLCRQFYWLGWVSGTGGGLSIKQSGTIYCAPSGVQKERIKPEDLFELDVAGNINKKPSNPRLKCSECLSLFMCAFNLRNAGCCIHNHSIYANLVTSLCYQQQQQQSNNSFTTTQAAVASATNYHQISNGFTGNSNTVCQQQQQTNNALVKENGTVEQRSSSNKYVEFKISHQEMIKGITKGSSNEWFNYTDTLVVPIVNNVLYERDLAGAMADAINAYPQTNAVLVRNHGCYVWGKTWQQAKSMAECYDYLFRLKVESQRLGVQL